MEIVIPRFGWNMEEGIFLGWLRQPGDVVAVGDPLFTLEGDKAVQEVEATAAGVLRITANGPKEGDTVPVGTVLGYVETSTAEPAVPVRRAATPRARRAARERQIDIAQVRGSGRGGRVRERDVLAVAGPKPEPPAVTPTPEDPIPPGRRALAARLAHSFRTTVPVTLTTTVDATNLANLRAQFRSAAVDDIIPSYTDILVKLTALTLRHHPRLVGRGVAGSDAMNVGIAVDTEAGVVVPVVRDVPSLTLRGLARRTRDLAERARRRQLSPSDCDGGRFTVSNLGAFGVDAFTPIINAPECSILGVGRIRRVPAAVDERVVVRDAVTLSLTFDHRLVDGAPAARFLQALGRAVENPAALLVE